MNRRSFVKTLSTLAAVSIVGEFLQGCAGGGAASSGTVAAAGGNCLANGTSVDIELVHSPNHTLTVPQSDVAAGVQRTYTLTDNGSGHTHQITLTSADFSALQANTGVQKTSTAFGHSHIVTVNCA